MLEQFALMARYNQWMNGQIYAAAGALDEDELSQQRGAYFGSILGTLNHIMVGDRVWLARFADHPARHPALGPILERPAPVALDQLLHHDLDSLRAERERLDALIIAWQGQLSADDLGHVLRYRNMRGAENAKPFASLLMHFYNHQTHHRGQVTTLLSQAGVEVGVTDLLALIDNVAVA